MRASKSARIKAGNQVIEIAKTNLEAVKNGSAYQDSILLQNSLQNLNTARYNPKTDGFSYESQEDGNKVSLMRIRSTQFDKWTKPSPYYTAIDQTDPFKGIHNSTKELSRNKGFKTTSSD